MLIEDRIVINAPRSVVWDITCDIEAWPSWLPTMTSVRRVDSGPFGLGSAADIKQPGQSEVRWTVTAFEDGRSFTWVAPRPGITVAGSHLVTEVDGGTECVVSIEVTGFLGFLLGPMLKTSIARTIALENTTLKAVAERRAQAH